MLHIYRVCSEFFPIYWSFCGTATKPFHVQVIYTFQPDVDRLFFVFWISRESRELDRDEQSFVSCAYSVCTPVSVTCKRSKCSIVEYSPNAHRFIQFMHIEGKWWVWIVATLIVSTCCFSVSVPLVPKNVFSLRILLFFFAWNCIFVHFYFCNAYKDFLLTCICYLRQARKLLTWQNEHTITMYQLHE